MSASGGSKLRADVLSNSGTVTFNAVEAGPSTVGFFAVGLDSSFREFRIPNNPVDTNITTTTLHSSGELHALSRWTGTGMVGTWAGYTVGASGRFLSAMHSGNHSVGSISSGTSNTLFGVANDGNATLICGASGLVRRTTGPFSSSSTHTWATVTTGTTNQLNAITSVGSSTDTFVAVGNGGVIRRIVTTTSSTITSPTTQALFGVGIPNPEIGSGDRTVIAVGAGGTIIRSTNSGSTWTAVTSGVTTTLRCVTGPWNNNPAYPWIVVGDSGVILLSYNDGITWVNASTVITYPTGVNYRGVCTSRHSSIPAYCVVGSSQTIVRIFG